MWDIIRSTFSAIATMPILVFIVVFLGYSAFVHNRKKAIIMAMDISTLFFIVCDAALFNKLFNSTFGIFGILLVMIIGGGLLGNVHYRKDGTIPWKRILRVVWRVTFFATAFLNIILYIFVIFLLAFTVS